MARLLFITFLLFTQFSFGQTQNTSDCKIELFLLKKNMPSFDTAYRMMGKFNVKRENLQDTAFIKDSEIISYTIEKFKINNGQRKYKKEDHNIQLSKSINERLKRLGDIPLCCGIQYALVVNGEIIYGGYFWNHYSSFDAAATLSYINEDGISFVFGYAHREKDPRNNPTLLSCLKKSDRLILKKKRRNKK